MVTGFLQSVGHTIFRMGGASGDGVRSEGEDAGPMRLGHSGEPLYTTLVGHPVSDDNHSVTIGESGIVTFEDLHLFEKNAHFNRERIPERVVHAKGAGAHGYFEVTQYVTNKSYPYSYWETSPS